MALTPQTRASMELEVARLRARRKATSDDAEHERLGRILDRLFDRLAAPEGFDTDSDFTKLDRLMRQTPL